MHQGAPGIQRVKEKDVAVEGAFYKLGYGLFVD